MRYFVLISMFILWACSGAENKAAYRQAQIDMVRQQQQSREAIATQREQAEAAKWKHAAAIVAANPESADAFAVAMAVSVVTQNNENDAPVITLQRESNEALEVVKAVAPALVGVIGHVGVAALNADVAKTQSRNNASVQINDSQQDARIVEAVAGLGIAASNQVSTAVGGDYYASGGDIDQSNSSVNSSNNPVDNSTTDNSTTDNAVSTSSETYTTNNGDKLTLEELTELIAGGIQITVIINGEETPVEQCESGSGLSFGGDSEVC